MTELTHNKIGYLKYAIGKWYENAKRDYGVVGNVTSISYNEDDGGIICIDFYECETEYHCTISFICDYTAYQLYDIWMDFLMAQEIA